MTGLCCVEVLPGLGLGLTGAFVGASVVMPSTLKNSKSNTAENSKNTVSENKHVETFLHTCS